MFLMCKGSDYFMIDKFIIRTKDKEPLELYGVGYKYYLNEDKIIIFTTDKKVAYCPMGAIIDIVDNAIEDKDDKFEQEMENIYYDKFKQTFCNIASTLVQEKNSVDNLFN